MPTLAFFPWVHINAETALGTFRLVPYVRGREPAGEGTTLQADVDAVLEPYCFNATKPVSRAALLAHAGQDFTAELGDEQVREYFLFSELLAFSAIAARDYFGLQYTNRDSYRLVIQPYEPAQHRVAVLSRRRDGNRKNMFGVGTYREIVPHHACMDRIHIDEPLLAALLRAWGASNWDPILEAIVSFNLANTDSPLLLTETEAVLTVGAIQRLLGCDSGNGDRLVEAFSEVFLPSEPMRPETCPRSSADAQVTDRFRRAQSVREGWLNDFYVLRGKLAHGVLTPDYPSVWTITEHLLLSAYVFPLLVKLVLASGTSYALLPSDRTDIDAFESLACARHFRSEQEEDAGKDWSRIRAAGKMTRWVREAPVETPSTPDRLEEAPN